METKTKALHPANEEIEDKKRGPKSSTNEFSYFWNKNNRQYQLSAVQRTIWDDEHGHDPTRSIGGGAEGKNEMNDRYSTKASRSISIRKVSNPIRIKDIGRKKFVGDWRDCEIKEKLQMGKEGGKGHLLAAEERYD